MILNSNLQDSVEVDSKAFYTEYPEWGYRILPHPDDLPEALGDFYMQLLK